MMNLFWWMWKSKPETGIASQSTTISDQIHIDDDSDTVSRFALGELSIAKGDFAEAERVFRDAILHDPQSRAGQSGMATTLFHLGRLEEAARHAQIATQLAPHDAKTWADYGHLLGQTGDLDAARRAYETALDADPTLAIGQAGLSGVLARQGNLEKAVQWAKAAAESDPASANLQTGLGYVLLERDNLEEATRAFEAALQIDETAAAAHVGLGIVLEKRGDLGEAIVRARRGAELAPQAVDIRAQLEHFLLLDKSYAAAAAAFRYVLAKHPSHSGAIGGDAIEGQNSTVGGVNREQAHAAIAIGLEDAPRNGLNPSDPNAPTASHR